MGWSLVATCARSHGIDEWSADGVCPTNIDAAILVCDANRGHGDGGFVMAATTEWIEDWVRLLVSDRMFESAQQLVQRGRYRDARRSADGNWVAAACQGSEPKPYAVVFDLSNRDRPVGRCTCPYKEYVRTQSQLCKHLAGLLLLLSRSPEQFAVVNASEAALADPLARGAGQRDFVPPEHGVG
jgi:hypothetical protein